MPMPGRSLSLSNYRFGFNGKENDNEVKGFGNWQDYGMRYYDPRLGRFPSVDPLFRKFPELTTYQFASDNPILNIDLDGLEGTANTVAPPTTVIKPINIDLVLSKIPLIGNLLRMKNFANETSLILEERYRKLKIGELRSEKSYDGFGFGILLTNQPVDVGKVGTVPDLHDMNLQEAEIALSEAGFEGGKPTEPGKEKNEKGDENKGGYRTFKNKDGSKVTIKPDGSVVRETKPRYDGLTGARSNKGEKLIKSDEGFVASKDQKLIHENRDKFPEKVKMGE